MPLYDHQCADCGHIFESLAKMDDTGPLECPECGGKARRIISVSGTNCANEDAEWIRSVTEVVPKGEDATPIDREFVRNPTRTNYRRWMKARGLRHLEPGEKPGRPKRVSNEEVARKLWERRQKRNRIYIGG